MDDSGNVTQQLIRTYCAVWEDAGGVQPTSMSAATADDGTNRVPLCGELSAIDGQAGFKAISCVPKRSSQSPNVFENQVTWVRRYTHQPPSSTKWQVDISIGGVKFTQTAYRDKDNTPINNTAGQAFDPSVPKTFYDEAITISYKTTEADSAVFAGLRGKVNSGDVTFTVSGMERTFTARQLLCDEVTMKTALTLGDNTTPVWDVQINLIARQDTFVFHVLNCGYYQIDPNGSGKLVVMKDVYGDNLNAPGNLDNGGAQQDPATPPVYLEFKVEAEADFTDLFAGLS